MALHQAEEDATNPNPSEKKKTTTTTTTTKQQWRFTWETLAHSPTLRLYLFRPPGSTDPFPHCSDLRASLCLVESLLLVSFLDLEAPAPASASAAARQVVLRLPVPRVLIDPGCPVECVAKSDHFEIKLALIVPVDHPLIKEFRGALDLDRDVLGSSDHDTVLLSMNDDLKSISSGGVDFYCNTCSTKLTKQPLRLLSWLQGDGRYFSAEAEGWRRVVHLTTLGGRLGEKGDQGRKGKKEVLGWASI